MSKKSTKEARKKAPSGTMTDERWNQKQTEHAKGSDSTVIDESCSKDKN